MRQSFPQGEISGIVADLSTAEGANAFFAQAPDADILVNNVGTAFIRDYKNVGDIANIPDEDWLGLFQLNVMSGVRLTRHYLPRMVAKGWGRVVFVSSESAVNVPKEMLDYGMTKTAQLAVLVMPRRSRARASPSTPSCPAPPGRKSSATSWRSRLRRTESRRRKPSKAS
jgi:NAD(P)-dependent dehydrogenase (short-subunit alcohol dehydrogenase family)